MNEICSFATTEYFFLLGQNTRFFVFIYFSGTWVWQWGVVVQLLGRADPLRPHDCMPAFPVDSPCSFTFGVTHASVITVGFLLEIFFHPHLALPPDAFFCWLKSSTVICGFPEREPPWSGGESRLRSKPGVRVPNRALILEWVGGWWGGVGY